MVMPTRAVKGPSQRPNRGPRILFLLVMCAASLLARVSHDNLTAEEILDDRVARQQESLRARVQFTWEQTPLRDGLHRLGTGTGAALVVDRRLDPEATVTLDMDATPLGDCLQALAELQGCGISLLPHAAYFGPASTTREMATLLAIQQERLRQLPPALQERWHALETASWPKLSEPRRLVEERAARHGIQVEESARIPHDLWAETTLPEMPLLEQLVILLAGFDLAPEVDQSSGHVRIVTMPQDLRITRTYPRTSPRSTLPEIDGRDAPGVTIDESRRQWTVTAPLEFHQAFEEAVRGTPSPRLRRGPTAKPTPPRTRDARPQQRFTLTVKNQPLGAILKTISRETGLGLQWNVEEGRWADTLRSVSVQNASLDVLLAELFQGLPIVGQVEDARLRVDLRP